MKSASPPAVAAAGLRPASETGSAHALGLYLDQAKKIHFFDPNVGEYVLKNPGGFKDAYMKILTESFKWKYVGATGWRVGAPGFADKEGEFVLPDGY